VWGVWGVWGEIISSQFLLFPLFPLFPIPVSTDNLLNLTVLSPHLAYEYAMLSFTYPYKLPKDSYESNLARYDHRRER
jgi:hypothetical protein